MKRKLLLLELWGLGDLTLSTAFIRKALAAGYEIDLVAKDYARPLLEQAFPGLNIISFTAPWTAPKGKYHLWKWNWRAVLGLLWRLRGKRYDVAVSVRWDPRDHFVMWLTGARQRLGFPRLHSQLFLTRSLERPATHRHKVEDWCKIGEALGFPGVDEAPRLLPTPEALAETAPLLPPSTLPLFILHAGAAAAVRRWPEAYFREIIERLRSRYSFHLLLIPDPTGHGRGLSDVADCVAADLPLSHLLALLARGQLFIGNDSGPAHIAAALGVPILSFFGPNVPELFRPWGDDVKVVTRDLCTKRPCFDACPFPEPYCMTRLLPAEVWAEVDSFVGRLIGPFDRSVSADNPDSSSGSRSLPDAKRAGE